MDRKSEKHFNAIWGLVVLVIVAAIIGGGIYVSPCSNANRRQLPAVGILGVRHWLVIIMPPTPMLLS